MRKENICVFYRRAPKKKFLLGKRERENWQLRCFFKHSEFEICSWKSSDMHMQCIGQHGNTWNSPTMFRYTRCGQEEDFHINDNNNINNNYNNYNNNTNINSWNFDWSGKSFLLNYNTVFITLYYMIYMMYLWWKVHWPFGAKFFWMTGFLASLGIREHSCQITAKNIKKWTFDSLCRTFVLVRLKRKK